VKKMLILMFVFCLCFNPLAAVNTAYRISDNKSYSDVTYKLNNGTLKLGEGDSLLLKSGNTYSGYLRINETKGSETKPVVISSFGTGPKPVINGKGSDFGSLFIQNGENIIVDGLTLENSQYGLYYAADSGSPLKNVTVKNCTIDKCNGGAGIRIICPFPTKWTKVNNTNTVVENILVENNIVRSNTFYGILVGNSNNRFDADPVDFGFENTNWFRKVTVRNNDIKYSQCNGIVIFGAENGTVDNNTIDSTGIGKKSDSLASKNGNGNGNGIVISAARNITVQFNMVSNSVYSYTPGYKVKEGNNFRVVRGDGDGDSGGISIDLYTKDILCQHNVFFNNGMNGIAIMTLNYKDPKTNLWKYIPNTGAVIRHNICFNNSATPQFYTQKSKLNLIYANDSLKAQNPDPYKQWLQRSGEIRISGPVDNCRIYGNTFISSPGALQMISETNWNGWVGKTEWSENKFYIDNPDIRYEYLGGPNVFDNNIFSSEPQFYKNDIDNYKPSDKRYRVYDLPPAVTGSKIQKSELQDWIKIISGK
jgi:parallel beta-helix repeat protein